MGHLLFQDLPLPLYNKGAGADARHAFSAVRWEDVGEGRWVGKWKARAQLWFLFLTCAHLESELLTDECEELAARLGILIWLCVLYKA